MLVTVLTIVTPVFALMGLGFLAAKTRFLPDGAGQALAQFAFKLAIPALLFRALLGSGTLEASPWRLFSAYFAATLCIWIIASLVAALVLRKPAEDQSILAMGSSFGNTVMLGIPIGIAAFGPEVTTPMALLVAVEAPLLWIAATLHIEFARRGRAISPVALAGVFRDLATNTIILSLVLGLAGRAMGWTLPAVPDRIVMMLGQAGVPTALFALGMALASFRIAGETKAIGLMMVLKLALYPALAYVFAAHVFQLPPLWTALVVLQAAMPVGANAYLFAAQYERSAATVSAAIAVSTLAAVVTVSGLLVVVLAGLGR
jgi:malonate transporter and related proteins